MAKNEDPQQDVTLNMAQLVDLVQSLTKANALDASAIADIAAKASISAAERLAPPKEHPYPAISAFNPEGELKNPRPALLGDIYWVGYLLRGDELTRQEIELVNGLRPGDYEVRARSGQPLPFKVRDLDPGSRESRRLLVLFPSATADQRHDLPTMVEMLQQVVAPAVAA